MAPTATAGKAMQQAPPTSSRSQRVSSPTGQKFAPAPAFSPFSTVLGNQAMLSLLESGQIQAKLRVSQPGDHDEIEADRVASEVISKNSGGPPSQRPSLPLFAHSAPALHRKCSCSGSVSKCAACEEEETASGKGIHRKASSDVSIKSGPDNLTRSLGSGNPLDSVTRDAMQSGFGRDFSNVRIHTGPEAATAAQSVNARAFTVGNDVVFNSGEYSPSSHSGQTLIAHELAHTVQQTRTPLSIHRAPKTTADKPAGATSFIQEGWSDLNELGIVYREGAKGKGGANIYESPDGPLLDWLPQNTRVYIIRQDNKPKGWYAVASAGGMSQFGYVAKADIWRNLPDPESEVVKIRSGDTALGLARRHYKNKGFDVSGKDKRYIVNALVWVNSHAKHNSAAQPGIFKGEWHLGGLKVAGKNDDRSPWELTQLTAGVYIWLPGAAYLNAIYEEVAEHGGGTGSIKEDLLRTAKRVLHYVEYGLAFIGGLFHGFFKSLYDAVAGLVTMIYDILKSIFTGSVISDVRELASKVGSLKWQDIKDAIGDWATEWAKKVDSDDPWIAGHAHGYLTGYIMAEAAMLLLSGGAIESIKGAVWGSRLGKAIQETAAFKKLATGVAKVGELSEKARGTVAKAAAVIKETKLGKVAVGTAKVIQWTVKGIATVLALPAEIAQYLTEQIVQSLKRLEPQFERIKKFSQTAKRWLFGCHSPCNIDVEAMASRLKLPDKIIEEQAERELGAAASKSAVSPPPAAKTSTAKAAPKPHDPTLPAPPVLSNKTGTAGERLEFIRRNRSLLSAGQQAELDALKSVRASEEKLAKWEKEIDRKLRKAYGPKVAAAVGGDPAVKKPVSVTAQRIPSKGQGADWERTQAGLHGTPSNISHTVKTDTDVAQFDQLGKPGGRADPREIKSHEEPPSPKKRAERPSKDTLAEMEKNNRAATRDLEGELRAEQQHEWIAHKFADQMERQARIAKDLNWAPVKWEMNSKAVEQFFTDEVMPLVPKELRGKIQIESAHYFD
jgi:hypothetical protein